MDKIKLKVFTAFSGYDSQCMALDKLKQDYNFFDYELVGWAEIDKPAIASHNAVFPEYYKRNYGDISKIKWDEVPDFDLFTYSSPCQDFSICGTQKGGTAGTGTRSSLLWECQRTIEEKRPKFLLLENVKALYEDHEFRPLLLKWKETVDSYGYNSYIKVVNAFDCDIPQGRERVFMVSIKKDVGEPDSYYWPKEMENKRDITDFLIKDYPVEIDEVNADKTFDDYYDDDESNICKFYDLLVNTGGLFNETTQEHKHLVTDEKRVVKKRRYKEEENIEGLI